MVCFAVDAMAQRAVFVLVLLIGCGGKGVLGGGAGAGGTGGATTCRGAAPSYCLAACSSDVGWPATCAGGIWSCPSGTMPATSCTCIGLPPPGYVCGPGGWVAVDGGAGGRGGAGDDGGAVDGAGGQGGRGGTGGESCSTMGASCAAPAWCCAGLTCQVGVCVSLSSTDAGSDAGSDGGSDAATCTGSTGFACLIGSCSNDVAMPATCRGGVWACPPGTVDTRSCHGCFGNPPPGWVCGDGGWMNPDASSGGTGG